MKHNIPIIGLLLILCIVYSASAAGGSISKEYQGMWGAGGCGKAKYYVRIEGSGMRMYAADKRMPLGNWDVRSVKKSGKGIIIDTLETNSKKATHMELNQLPNGHISLSLDIGGNGGTDELVSC